MPRMEIWNNVTDCYELILTPPFNKEDFEKEEFPLESDIILNNIEKYSKEAVRDSLKYKNFCDSINSYIASKSYALVRDSENGHKRYFLSFGVNITGHNNAEYPISIQLGLDKPNWQKIKQKLGFYQNYLSLTLLSLSQD